MTPTTLSLHALLLLSDSALPLGSFAFSSGLESFLAHNKKPPTTSSLSSHPRSSSSSSSSSPSSSPSSSLSSSQSLTSFLHHSLHNTASTLLPFVLAGWHRPDLLRALDEALDAATACKVARRASIAQGKAMGTVWKRGLKGAAAAATEENGDVGEGEAQVAVDEFVALLGQAMGQVPHGGMAEVDALLEEEVRPQGHFPPLFGAVSRALGLGEADMAYVFLFNHVKAVLSAMVRAGVMGPYQSQSVLAGREMGRWIVEAIEEVEARVGKGWSSSPREGGDLSEGRVWALVDSAGVSVPAIELWMGRHELLYSRIFNS